VWPLHSVVIVTVAIVAFAVGRLPPDPVRTTLVRMTDTAAVRIIDARVNACPRH
jgi:hypothetical protein